MNRTKDPGAVEKPLFQPSAVLSSSSSPHLLGINSGLSNSECLETDPNVGVSQQPHSVFQVEKWVAWAPGLETSEDWNAWAMEKKHIENESLVPNLDYLPPLFRRRLSQLSKMSVHVALQCLADQEGLPAVFASRYGEIHNTEILLEKLHEKEPLSPAYFSMSVHNTAAGLYSIAKKVTHTVTAVAAGGSTFESGLLSAIALLEDYPKVLYVVGDEKLPNCYEGLVPNSPFPHALALLLSRSNGAGKTIQIQGIKKEEESGGTSTLSFLKQLIQNPKNIRLRTHQFEMHIRASCEMPTFGSDARHSEYKSPEFIDDK